MHRTHYSATHDAGLDWPAKVCAVDHLVSCHCHVKAVGVGQHLRHKAARSSKSAESTQHPRPQLRQVHAMMYELHTAFTVVLANMLLAGHIAAALSACWLSSAQAASQDALHHQELQTAVTKKVQCAAVVMHSPCSNRLTCFLMRLRSSGSDVCSRTARSSGHHLHSQTGMEHLQVTPKSCAVQ